MKTQGTLELVFSILFALLAACTTGEDNFVDLEPEQFDAEIDLPGCCGDTPRDSENPELEYGSLANNSDQPASIKLEPNGNIYYKADDWVYLTTVLVEMYYCSEGEGGNTLIANALSYYSNIYYIANDGEPVVGECEGYACWFWAASYEYGGSNLVGVTDYAHYDDPFGGEPTPSVYMPSEESTPTTEWYYQFSAIIYNPTDTATDGIQWTGSAFADEMGGMHEISSTDCELLLELLQAGEQADQDWDGYIGDDDCDDEDFTTSVFAAEICDGVNNDCDDAVDEGVASYDEDADGVTTCEGDCDDTDPQNTSICP